MSESFLHLLLVLIAALPLGAAVVTAALGPRLLRQQSHVPTVAALVAATICSAALLVGVGQRLEEADGQSVGWSTTVQLWSWAEIGEAYGNPPASAGEAPAGFDVGIVLRADTLTATMLAMVTFVATFIAIYSIGYMHDDPSYWRFFSYISLFAFSMTMLVSVSNFVLLYVFWEAVGLCSYLLIGFWYTKREAAAAGKKAFLVNRVGDFGFALAVMLIWTTYGTLNFHDTPQAAGVLGQTMLEDPQRYVAGGVGLAICLLLMLGACGKSAQFPLHVWLPDAMEGPTPVSALIHAATMVTAGVYLVTRCMPLFLVSPAAQTTVAVIGGTTALMAGAIAMSQNDLKRVLAYSTISQLGYMFLSLGTGTLLGVVAGMFHLLTHAFFKALLFLGAGSVMHAMGGVIDIRRMGGLRRRMPVTHATFLVGCLALAGIAPLSGFWSKDSILGAVHQRAHHGDHAAIFWWLYVSAMVTVVLTSFYTFRAFFKTFYGPERIPAAAGGHAHESPRSMTVPLLVLALCAAGAGGLLVPFSEFLVGTPTLADPRIADGQPAHEMHLNVALTSTTCAVAGLLLAGLFYVRSADALAWVVQRIRGLYVLSREKFFLDEIYRVLIVWPCLGLATAAYWFDRRIIDGLVHAAAAVPLRVGQLLRGMQTGLVQVYALLMVLGLVAVAGILLR